MNSLSDLVRFGTSSWAYEGWQGLVYHRAYPKGRFSQDTLAEYAAHTFHDGESPLFRTVGIDHSFYHPADANQLAHYAGQVPDGFHFCQKVWEDITVPAYANLPRYGARAGKSNPHFLDVSLFHESVLTPSITGLGGKLGPFIFEFQRWGIEAPAFLNQLDQFLERLPSGQRYAVEIRNPALLGRRYADILRARNVAHVYNHWTSMPPLASQHQVLDRRFSASFAVLRLLTPLGLAYEKAVARYKPYNRVVQEQPRMRQDTVLIIKQAVHEGIPIYVLANNRAEGCSPLTVQALKAAL
ncbi:conserved protein of unknown function [Nitrospira japonica]|uniref:DUF72 domain-containing protein n=1 Tax=Nitrospira japonica TaxID=1325564 RepID=A0A1W1I646_9BACT|nr:DUF72 domain-containing protein [Nitrospira japonica]SLM48470.1 conserved protein of unknown function [Nitrospira japonica]